MYSSDSKKVALKAYHPSTTAATRARGRQLWQMPHTRLRSAPPACSVGTEDGFGFHTRRNLKPKNRRQAKNCLFWVSCHRFSCSPLTTPPPWLQSANDIAGPGPPVGPDRYVRKVHPPKSPRIWWPARQAPPCCAGPHHPRAALSPCRSLAVGGGTRTGRGFAAGICCGLSVLEGNASRPEFCRVQR
jgi:hypothetical protein